MKEEPYNVYDAHNAYTEYVRCLELFMSQKKKAKELCDAGLLEIEILQLAGNRVLEKVKHAVTLMKKRKFIAVLAHLAERKQEFTQNGLRMYRYSSPVNLFAEIQAIKNSEADLRKFRSNGRSLSQTFFSSEQGAVLTFDTMCEELQRHGYLHNGELYLTGREIKSLYRFLEKNKYIKPLKNLVEVYNAFAASFNLQINSASSLQRIPDDDDEINAWRNVFLRTKSGDNSGS